MSISFKDLFLTSEYILENVSEEDIFEHYLYPVDYTVKYTNPFRVDNHPDCNYYVGKTGILYFVDNAWNKKHYSCFNVVMEHYKCTFREALKHIYEDLISGDESSVKRDVFRTRKDRVKNIASDLKIKIKKFTSDELKFWNIGNIEVTEEELKKKGIHSVETLWENSYIYDNLKHVFAYVEDNKITQIYFPKRKKGERRFINTIGFTVGNLNNLQNDTEILVITKSRKDCFFLEKFGINSIYTVNEAITIDSELFKKLSEKYTYIFTLMDDDRQGKHSAWTHRKLYGITPLFVEQGKDFSGWLESVGYQEVIDVIENFKQKLE